MVGWGAPQGNPLRAAVFVTSEFECISSSVASARRQEIPSAQARMQTPTGGQKYTTGMGRNALKHV